MNNMLNSMAESPFVKSLSNLSGVGVERAVTEEDVLDPESNESVTSVDTQGRHRRPSLHHQDESSLTHRHFEASEHVEGIHYRHQELQQVLDLVDQTDTIEERREMNKHVMEKLANLGVSVFLISYECSDIWKEVKYCIYEASSMALYDCSTDKCLLYEDEKGRLFNMIVSGDFPADSWKTNLSRASGFEAIAASVVLARAFACVEVFTGIRPAYITLILGLVLTEEISNAWINASMLVWGMPSISAYCLTQPFSMIDWPKQLLLFVLALAAVAESESQVQRIMTLCGIGWAIAILTANVGARAWRTLKLQPFKYRGPFRNTLSFIAAMFMGILIPYIGFRQAKCGGQLALETVIIGAFLVAVVFVVSDFDIIQNFIVVGSQRCGQDSVNFGIGIWWFITVIMSMYFVRMIPNQKRAERELAKQLASSDATKEGGSTPYIPEPESLVEEEQDSPVGYRVKQIPDFKLDPSVVCKSHLPSGFLCCEVLLGLTMAVVVGGLIVALAFTDADDKVTSRNYNEMSDV